MDDMDDMDELEAQVAQLPDRMKEEWHEICGYHSIKTAQEVFEEFIKRYDECKGPTLNEFLSMPDTAYTEWQYWKYCQRYYQDFKQKSFSQVWTEFKDYWQLDTLESKLIFKEMELLSDNMRHEWRLKYRFRYPHVYEEFQRGYELKSKAQLWKEFKEIWEIDVANYNEDKMTRMLDFISRIEWDSREDYRDNYPRNFFEYREDSNYHSYDSFSTLQQYEICLDWEDYRNE